MEIMVMELAKMVKEGLLGSYESLAGDNQLKDTL